MIIGAEKKLAKTNSHVEWSGVEAPNGKHGTT